MGSTDDILATQPTIGEELPVKGSALRTTQDRFVNAWGQMGATWGISRTMAEVHALLYIAGQPMCTDDVMERLEISRGNASMSLRSLVDWGLVSRAHKRGDRKEYFQAECDVWSLLRAVVRERMKREIRPILQSLYELREVTASGDAPATRSHNQRLDDMIGLIRTIEQLGDKLVQMRADQIRELSAAITLPES